MANGINAKNLRPNEILSEITGSKLLSRGDITKKIWDYAKENGFNEGKYINAKSCPILSKLMGKKLAGMGDIAKAISANTTKE
jgi:chromatin remodeling complex protein RSC6